MQLWCEKQIECISKKEIIPIASQQFHSESFVVLIWQLYEHPTTIPFVNRIGDIQSLSLIAWLYS